MLCYYLEDWRDLDVNAICVWHDTICNRSHLLITINCCYDPAIFSTDQEGRLNNITFFNKMWYNSGVILELYHKVIIWMKNIFLLPTFIGNVGKHFARHLNNITFHLINITFHLINITFHLINITFHLINITFYLINITFHLINITFHLINITFHLINITFHPINITFYLINITNATE